MLLRLIFDWFVQVCSHVGGYQIIIYFKCISRHFYKYRMFMTGDAGGYVE